MPSTIDVDSIPDFQKNALADMALEITRTCFEIPGMEERYQQCLAMARTNNTPVDFWLSLRLGEFSQWVKASNALIAEEMEKRKQKRK